MEGISLKNLRISRVSLGLTALYAEVAMATSTTQMAWETPLDEIKASITGPTATSICAIAIAVCGLALVFGSQINDFVRKIIQVILAIAVALGSNNILGIFGVSGYLLP